MDVMEEQKSVPALTADKQQSPPSAPSVHEAPNEPRNSIPRDPSHEAPVQHKQEESNTFEEHRVPLQQPNASVNLDASGPAQQQQSTRLKTACSNCRQQKIKCRTTDELATPCERCARMKLNCLYEPRHSRARPRSDSDTANDTPKRRLVSRTGENGFTTFTTVNAPADAHYDQVPASNGDRIAAVPRLPFASEPLESTAIKLPYNGASDRRPSLAGSAISQELHPLEKIPSYRSPAQTVSRSLDGLHFRAELIDDLFAQFFKHYHPFLPILDPSVRPNACHSQSSFLFWSVITIASRRWPRDTALSSLRTKVIKHATTSISSPTLGLSTLTAVLLLCHWSLLETKSHDELPYVQSSAILSAAIRLGLHIPYAANDFTRKDVPPSPSEQKRNYQLYTYSLLLQQRYEFVPRPNSPVTNHLDQICLLHGKYHGKHSTCT